MAKNQVSKNSRKKILKLEKSLINIADGVKDLVESKKPAVKKEKESK